MENRAQGDEDEPQQEIDFCTLAMFIIDEIHYIPPQPPVFNVLGGGGSYSALGARLLSPPPLSKSVSWIVDAGSDFPPDLATLISSWSTSCLFRSDPSRLTTRGWNGYDSSENRAFKYTTPKRRLTAEDLDRTLLFSKSFHLLCSPKRCMELVTTILRSRKRLNPGHPKPIFIWEPVPDLCTPSELLNLTNALPYVDVCSPNAAELASLLGNSELDPETGEVSTSFISTACEQLLGAMPLQSFTLVIRCGAQGCYIAKNGGRSRRPSLARRKRPANHIRGGLTLDMDMTTLFSGLLDASGSFIRDEVVIDPGIEEWLPAYFTSSDSEDGKVVDPTGGGNGFLGGMSVALARGKEVVEAAGWGSVAASFMIEQVGVPILGINDAGVETWNGEVVEDRLRKFRERVGKW